MPMTVKEWRKLRDQAGILLGLMDYVPECRKGEAWRIYYLWRDCKITFREAKRRLKSLKSRR